jgi:uncharacterized cupin superfamily protein
MTQVRPRFLAGLLALFVLGGGAPAWSAQLGTLAGVLVRTRPALAADTGRVRIIREGRPLEGKPGMPLFKGDVLITAEDGVAVVTLTAGYEVIFEPGNESTLENPSIFVRLGKVIVKALQEVREKLTLHSEFVSAGVEGTVFVYDIDRERTVHVTVVEGQVVVQGRTWPAERYRAGEAGTFRPGSLPSRMATTAPEFVRSILQRIRAVENALRSVVRNPQ